MSVLAIATPVDLALHRYRNLESYDTVNGFSLENGIVTLTLMADMVNGTLTDRTPIIRYHRQLHGSETFGITVDMGFEP